jgi:hypothetical protein
VAPGEQQADGESDEAGSDGDGNERSAGGQGLQGALVFASPAAGRGNRKRDVPPGRVSSLQLVEPIVATALPLWLTHPPTP